MSEDLKALTGLSNPLHRHGKADMAMLLVVLRGFAYGLSIQQTARKAGLTPKSTRDLYIQLRARLAGKRFAIWHRANRRLLDVPSQHIEDAIRADFFTKLSECYFDNTCYRNFQSGKRKSRPCRKCPLPDSFDSADDVGAALDFIDAIRVFYKRINIGAESTLQPVELLRQRAIHTATIIAAMQNTHRASNGAFDYKDRSPLSFRSLLEALIADLAEMPLS